MATSEQIFVDLADRVKLIQTGLNKATDPAVLRSWFAAGGYDSLKAGLLAFLAQAEEKDRDKVVVLNAIWQRYNNIPTLWARINTPAGKKYFSPGLGLQPSLTTAVYAAGRGVTPEQLAAGLDEKTIAEIARRGGIGSDPLLVFTSGLAESDLKDTPEQKAFNSRRMYVGLLLTYLEKRDEHHYGLPNLEDLSAYLAGRGYTPETLAFLTYEQLQKLADESVKAAEPSSFDAWVIAQGITREELLAASRTDPKIVGMYSEQYQAYIETLGGEKLQYYVLGFTA